MSKTLYYNPSVNAPVHSEGARLLHPGKLYTANTTVRYEGTKNFLVTPFEVGKRHLQVAFSRGSTEKLAEFAQERVIYRAHCKRPFSSLTFGERITHGVTGLLETAGYLTLILPFIALLVDIILNKPNYDGDAVELSEHRNEGGMDDDFVSERRYNPFTNKEAASKTPYYATASWSKA